jgi:hypothetical protein
MTMTMATEGYCDHLHRLHPAKAIRAIHEAYLQLFAVTANCDVTPYDCSPALASLRACLRDAGHPGFQA